MNLICIAELKNFTIGKTYVGKNVIDGSASIIITCGDDGRHSFLSYTIDSSIYDFYGYYFELESDYIERKINEIIV